MVGLRPGAHPRLVVGRGRVWVTQTGDGRDHILAPGEGLNLRPRGRVAVQALVEAELVLTDLVEDGAAPGPLRVGPVM